jgi:hypothetical protein
MAQGNPSLNVDYSETMGSASGASGKPWFFNLHPEDVNHDLSQANLAFGRIIELGGKGVRTDIIWSEVEPSRDNYDWGKVNFYKNYFELAKNKGLQSMAILGGWLGGRTPVWAEDLYKNDKAAFLEEFREFCQDMAKEVASYVGYYQIWNEANHPIGDGIAKEDDWKVLWYGGKGVKDGDPSSIRFVNLICDGVGGDWGFNTAHSWFNEFAKKEEVIDGLGIDHYPATWDIPGNGSNWEPLDNLLSFMRIYRKLGAITETGFSSWAWEQADEHDQENWVHIALPIIDKKVISEGDFIFCNWYELQDANTNGWGVENHWGIYHTDWTKKLAWDDLKAEIANF